MTQSPAPSDKIARIGFFHFRKDYESPISALAEQIELERSNEDIRNSLIVLPEAFNFGRHYDFPKVPYPLAADNILKQLQDLASPRGLTFIVGILENRRNSAYWVEASGWNVICHKIGNDCKDLYESVSENTDPCNPRNHAGIDIATLICMDADQYNYTVRERRDRVCRSLSGKKVICIPSRFSASYVAPGNLPEDGSWYVVADGGKSFPSYVVDASRTIRACEPSNAVNRVKTVPL